MSSHHLACDLGAESGRVMLGLLDNQRLVLEEIHRFPNLVVRLDNSLRWDILRTFSELKTGLSKAAGRGLRISSLSVDSWGVDYVWSGYGQQMLAPAYIYRDPRTDATFEKAMRDIGRDRIFRETGIQFMTINTIYHLMDDIQRSPALISGADGFLCIADYLNFLFSGRRAAEQSLASTTQLYNPVTRQWSKDLIQAIGLKESLFPEIVPSGTDLGALLPEVAEETGLDAGTRVIASCSHDTGAAVAAVPAADTNDWAFLSSGTWSLIGVELQQPLISQGALDANFTNEGGFGGSTRFLKNIVGLWILQECRREWEKSGKDISYAELNALASDAPALTTIINPDDPRFLRPGDMLQKIRSFARETAQPEPETPGAFTRAVLESLALLYANTLENIEALTGRTIRTLHIVGGGSQSDLLNQFSANATGRTVVAGPVEATAIGNILIQALVSGKVASLAELRATVARSFPMRRFEPVRDASWENAFKRFAELRARS